MSIDIPADLFFPTVEELEERTAKDLAEKWKPSKRPGKKERNAIKHEKETAKLRAIASEYDSSKQFAQNGKPKFSLAAANASSGSPAKLRPTLKVSVEKAAGNGLVTSLIPPKPEINGAPRKRGRPPKVNPL